jgi:hypothetical protein
MSIPNRGPYGILADDPDEIDYPSYEVFESG